MKSKVKISDIARQSGVSISTVSLVLNGKPGASPETRKRVFEAADDLGYPIKFNGHTAAYRQLTTVGMVVKIDPDILPQANPFYSKIIMGIEDACRRRKINLLFATLPVDENNRPVETPQMLSNRLADGLIVVGTFVDENFAHLTKDLSTPIVLVDGYSINEAYDSVVSDNFRAAYQAVQFLVDRGHRHIGLVGGDETSFPSLRDRRNGYLRAMKENDLSSVYTCDFNINKGHGYQETISLLNEYPHITALFCINDDVGGAAIKAVQALGKRVPADVSIIGYDDTYIAANTHPALTTMHVDTIAMGRAAVHLLSLRLENPESARMTLTIHTTLVERQSASVSRVPYK